MNERPYQPCFSVTEYLNCVCVCACVSICVYKEWERMPRPLSRPHPLDPSLLVLAEHVVLFALHVFKVKVAPSHAFVDVLDVVASGLKVGGGVVGP